MRITRFNLIELILVVTVLIGLCSLLVPVIYNSRKQAKTTTCMENLQQTLGNRVVTYTNNHDGYLPTWEDGWVGALSKASGETLNQSAAPAGAWSCPSQEAVSTHTDVSPIEWWRGSHYGINIHIASNRRSSTDEPLPLWTRANVKKIRSARDKAVLGDSTGGNVFNQPGKDPTISGTNPEGLSTSQSLPPNPLPGMPYRRHQGGTSNILFLDLHVETVSNYPTFMLGRGTPGFKFWHAEHWYPELGVPEPGASRKNQTPNPAKPPEVKSSPGTK